MDIWKCKVPEAGTFLEYLKNSKEDSVARAECTRGKVQK